MKPKDYKDRTDLRKLRKAIAQFYMPNMTGEEMRVFILKQIDWSLRGRPEKKNNGKH